MHTARERSGPWGHWEGHYVACTRAVLQGTVTLLKDRSYRCKAGAASEQGSLERETGAALVQC